ncbi:PREDICTED: uncharacterized protein LOC105449146 [Wasmannia auropunctata]|uniref:uncharacterized protein LOC105449146 n=1 Tax=Wasmannia auropunctata TaxID=64793 RepID=UPI0005EE4C69|nr:PREDICTED: uncharacterized protein LOC105449146 [Wasmannia auropunctata]
MNELLSDRNTYEIIKKDPTKKLTGEVRTLLSNWKNKEYIDHKTYRELLNTDGSIPRAYGLPKIHKTGYPLRIIVSSINSPLYNLAQFLHLTIKNSIPEADSHVTSSFQLVNKLKGICLDPNEKFASLDVVSLFTNVPTDLAVKCISDNWEVMISSEPNKLSPLEERYGIHVSPEQFPIESSLEMIHNEWFVNLSNITFPPEVQLLLQLGEKFGLPLTNIRWRCLMASKYDDRFLSILARSRTPPREEGLQASPREAVWSPREHGSRSPQVPQREEAPLRIIVDVATGRKTVAFYN